MEIIGLILDGLVIALLAATIFIAWKLSDNISAFRKSRKDLDKLVKDLAQNIDKADRAIAGMRNATQDVGKDLQGLVNEARALSEELQLMTTSGDNLAGRLEKLVDRSREISPSQARRETAEQPSSGLTFSIHDREFGKEAEGGFESAFSFPEDDEWAESGSDLHSKAERELQEMVRKNKSKPGRVL